MKVVAKPIEVIAWFGKDGKINPIKFRIEQEEIKVIKIEKVLKREKEKLAGRYMEKFLCSSVVDGAEKLFELKFDILSSQWILFKI